MPTKHQLYRRRYPERFQAKHLKTAYGMTLANYNEMFDRQRGVCLICHKPGSGGGRAGPRLCVDHDHRTGRVRGLLCQRCNRALGFFDEDAERLFTAALYLEGN